MKRALQIGDRVRFSSQFLRTGCHYTGPFPQARGTITGFWGGDDQMAHIRWDHPYFDNGRNGGAHTANLQKIKR